MSTQLDTAHPSAASSWVGVNRTPGVEPRSHTGPSTVQAECKREDVSDNVFRLLALTLARHVLSAFVTSHFLLTTHLIRWVLLLFPL